MANQFHLLNNSNDDQQENHNIQSRSIDDYLDTAYQHSSIHHLIIPYMIYCNIGDIT